VLTGATSGATAVVDQVVLTSGTWAGGNAAGALLLKKVVGAFSNGEYLRVSSINMARAAAASVLGLRGYTAVTEYGANVPSFKTLADSIGKFEEPDMSKIFQRQLDKPVGVLDISEFQKRALAQRSD
jgi:hypothetical protein